MTLLGRMARIHILNATPHLYNKKGGQSRMWLCLLILACLLILLGKLT